MDESGISSTESLLVNARKAESTRSRMSASMDSHPMFQGTHEEYLANKKVTTVADRFVSIFFWVAVAAAVALVAIVIASLVLQSKMGKPLAVTSYYKTITLSDGTQLSALVTRPIDMKMKRPIVYEVTSKRKDDAQYAQSWATAFELGKRGLIVVQIDARGTGASTGTRSPLPYSPQDVKDGVEVIGKLLKDISANNGQVGIFGLGTSATLALLIAQQKPKGLGAVVALHASENAFWNDMYADGNLQFDLYRAKQEQLSILPRSPMYNAYDPSFFNERFNITTHPPYLFSYLAHQTFDDFWKSLSPDTVPTIGITVPVYLIGGIYNAHKDFALDLYNRLLPISTKVKVVLGPFGYNWPDENPANLGPSFNARLDVANWFKQWLNDEDNGFLRQPDISMFYRDEQHKNGGDWRFEGWPIARAVPTKFATHGPVQNMTFDATSGVELGDAWGPKTPNQVNLDQQSATTAIKAITTTTTINGFPAFSLRVKTGLSLVNWNVRLEDVAPDGTVTLVTGCTVNGAMTREAPTPALPAAGTWHIITGTMHYTTWVFHFGHTARLSVSNSAPGMQWATPASTDFHPEDFAGDVQVDFGSTDSWVQLAYIPLPEGRPVRVPKFTSEAASAVAVTPLGFPYNRTLAVNAATPGQNRELIWHQAEGTYANANDVLIVGFVGQIISVLNTSWANMSWVGEATNVLVLDVDGDTKSDPPGLPGPYLYDILDTLQTYYSYGENPAVTVTTNQNPMAQQVPNLSLHNRAWIRIDSSTTVQSDLHNYYATATRKMTGDKGALPDQTVSAVFPRMGH